MIITKLYGGLGNQLFQYALGRVLANKLKTVLKLDISWFELENSLTARNYELSFLNIQENFASADEIEFCKLQKRNYMFGPLRKFLNKPKYYVGNYREKELFVYDEEVLNQCINTYFDGYWQSYKYTDKIREILLSEFSLKKSFDDKNKNTLKKMNSVNSVSVHIRRGDYVNNEQVNKVHGVCSLDYYNNAIEIIAKKVDNPFFFVFSDDIEWVKNNLKTEHSLILVDYNDSNSGYLDMMLMKNCKHSIIANSSFSWWGAWLNEDPQKIVISPTKWFNDYRNVEDLIPENWIKINA